MSSEGENTKREQRGIESREVEFARIIVTAATSRFGRGPRMEVSELLWRMKEEKLQHCETISTKLNMCV